MAYKKPVKIGLLSQTVTADAMGQQKTVEVEREVNAFWGSVSRAEWADAGRLGLKASCVFTCYSFEYNGETAVNYNGGRYSIYRTYQPTDDRVELYCEQRAGTNG